MLLRWFFPLLCNALHIWNSDFLSFVHFFAVLIPIQASIGYPSAVNSLAPGYPTWDDASLVVRAPASGILSSQDEYNLHGAEGMLTLKYFIKSIFSTINFVHRSFVHFLWHNFTDSDDIGSKGTTRIRNNNISGTESLSRAHPASELLKHGKQGSLIHGNHLLYFLNWQHICIVMQELPVWEC